MRDFTGAVPLRSSRKGRMQNLAGSIYNCVQAAANNAFDPVVEKVRQDLASKKKTNSSNEALLASIDQPPGKREMLADSSVAAALAARRTSTTRQAKNDSKVHLGMGITESNVPRPTKCRDVGSVRTLSKRMNKKYVTYRVTA